MILVTGGTGFLGKYLVKRLVAGGEKIRLLVRNRKTGVPDFDNHTLLEYAEGDILDPVSLGDAFSSIDRVFHLAAVVSFWRMKRRLMKITNVKGTENVVNTCLDKGIKKMVYVSSSAALGRNFFSEEITEQSKWKKSKYNTYYAQTKHLAELHVYRGMAEGLDAVIANPTVVIGPGDWHSGTPRLFRTIYKGLMFYHQGINNFVDVRDVAEGLVGLMEKGKSGQRYLIGGINLSYKELFDKIAERMNVPPPGFKVGGAIADWGATVIEYIGYLRRKEPMITQEVVRLARGVYRYDTSRFGNEFQFTYRNFEDTLDYTYENFRKEYVIKH